MMLYLSMMQISLSRDGSMSETKEIHFFVNSMNFKTDPKPPSPLWILVQVGLGWPGGGGIVGYNNMFSYLPQ
jgi:hypothetical protein